jgi:hypothetical protein
MHSTRRDRGGRRLRAVGAALALLAGGGVWLALQRPSHQRVWAPPQRVLPEVRREGPLVHVRNVRDFVHHGAEAYAPGWVDRSYDVRLLERAWLVVSPFSTRWRGPAHAFLSFGFADGSHVSVSVEARREEGEAYSLVKGMLRRYEMMVVVAEERDAIGLRLAWGDAVHLYPVRADVARIRAVFLEMMDRAEGIRARPEFYHTLWNNCTTNILDPVNTVADPPIPYGPRILLPGYLDAVAYERGLVDTELPLEEARAAFRVDPRAREAPDAAAFSRAVRGAPPGGGSE